MNETVEMTQMERDIWVWMGYEYLIPYFTPKPWPRWMDYKDIEEAKMKYEEMRAFRKELGIE